MKKALSVLSLFILLILLFSCSEANTYNDESDIITQTEQESATDCFTGSDTELQTEIESITDTEKQTETETESMTETEKQAETETKQEYKTESTSETVSDKPAYNGEKPKIGMSFNDSNNYNRYYISALEKAGAEVVVIPILSNDSEAAEWLEKVDGLLIPGGGDISPDLYGETNSGFSTDIYRRRDVSDLYLIKRALELDMPILGICRGMQILNVYLGGTLYQDIPTQLGSTIHRNDEIGVYTFHYIYTSSGSVLNEIFGDVCNLNSFHHQAIKDLGQGLVITAKAADGVIEGVEMPEKSFVVGVQFHPERMNIGQKLIKKFLEKSLEYRYSLGDITQ